MTSHKVDYSRRSIMLKVAAEAPAIRASETDDLENSSWPSKTAFFGNFPAFSDDGRPWKDDDQNMDLMALVVLDDFPAETLNNILRINAEEGSEHYLWLADTYDTLPDWDPARPTEGTASRVEETWRSPFIGSSAQEVAAFIASAPKPPKPLCKRFFAVLQKELYERNKQLLIYKILDVPVDGSGVRTLQAVPCPVNFAGFFFRAYDRYDWDQAVEEQALYFNEGAYWDDDDASTQVMALIVLDAFPTKTINKILSDDYNKSRHPHLWLADTYDNLPDYHPNHSVMGTMAPIDDSWRSPFVGKSIADAANFVRNTPKPPKPLCRRFFTVLQKDFYEQSGMALVCRISPGDVEDEIEGDYNKEEGVESFKNAGRSLMCKVVPDEKQRSVADDGVSHVTSALGDIDVTTQGDGVAGSEDQGGSEFKVEMIGYKADELGTFFSDFERFFWWDCGGADMA